MAALNRANTPHFAYKSPYTKSAPILTTGTITMEGVRTIELADVKPADSIAFAICALMYAVAI